MGAPDGANKSVCRLVLQPAHKFYSEGLFLGLGQQKLTGVDVSYCSQLKEFDSFVLELEISNIKKLSSDESCLVIKVI